MPAPDTRPADLPPPPNDGFDVEATSTGARVTLPAHYTTGDVIIAAVAAAVTVWMATWLDALRADGSGSGLAMAVLAAVGVVFGVLAVSQGFRIVARRVVARRDDRLVLGWRLGARVVPRESVPVAAITLVDRVLELRAGEAVGAEEVRIRTGDAEWRVGDGLDAGGLEWLEAAVRQLAGRR